MEYFLDEKKEVELILDKIELTRVLMEDSIRDISLRLEFSTICFTTLISAQSRISFIFNLGNFVEKIEKLIRVLYKVINLSTVKVIHKDKLSKSLQELEVIHFNLSLML